MKYKRKKEKDFWQLARSYLHDYMPVTRNLSDKSVEAYKQSLKTYLHYLEIEKSIVNEQVTFDVFSNQFMFWLSYNYRGRNHLRESAH